MHMQLRPATSADIPAMMDIINQGKAYLRSQQVDQWQKGDPNEQGLQLDIQNQEGYVLTQGDTIVATLAILLRDEPNYDTLDSGAWSLNGPYAALHRVAVAADSRGTGAADAMMQKAAALCKKAGKEAIRIDTHLENLPMQRFLEKNQFVRRGIITLQGGAEAGNLRVVYERALL